MEIRKANKEDVPEIVGLLKLSLGESLMPKSEEYWKWKHVDNPFGKSPVLLAVEEGQIIGLRAFMQWGWKKNESICNAIRAVDTATHPEHRGKGIFKELTLGLLDECKNEYMDLVFNTPNNKSKPGYLKMGWKEAGKLPVNVGFKKPLRIILNKIKKNTNIRFLGVPNEFGIREAVKLYKKGFDTANNLWNTNYTNQYLIWRYVNIPVIQYGGLASKNALVIFRLKQVEMGVELRICDVFGDVNEGNTLIRKVYNSLAFDYVTVSGFSGHKLPSLLAKSLNIGPEVTVRNINRKIDDFINFKAWSPTLGDLEVF